MNVLTWNDDLMKEWAGPKRAVLVEDEGNFLCCFALNASVEMKRRM
uniref:Uncharacterized protein n=1 Tax=Caenorhabditis japonica TaxID=281687 RepID=A0A8R1IUP5_CAEJA